MSRQDANAAFALTSFLYGANAPYIEDLYARYETDPNSVDAEWQSFFQSLKDDPREVSENARGPSWRRPDWPRPERSELIAALDGDWVEVGKALGEKVKAKAQTKGVELSSADVERATRNSIRALMLIRAYRARGHFHAHLDPLGLQPPGKEEELEPSTYGFGEGDFDRPIFLDKVLGLEFGTIRQIIAILRRTYCQTLGVEFLHISDGAQKGWIQERIEGPDKEISFTREGKRAILNKLVEVEGFEKFCDLKFTGTKRFGLDGAEIDDPGARADHQARRRARRASDRHGHGPSRPAQCAGASHGQAAPRHLPRIQGRLVDAERDRRLGRREVPSRRLLGPRVRRQQGASVAHRQSVASGNCRSGGARQGARQAGPAWRDARRPHHGDAAADPRRCVVRGPGRGGGVFRAFRSARPPHRRLGAFHRQQSDRLHDQSALFAVVAVSVRCRQDDRGADFPRQRRRSGSGRVRRQGGDRIPAEVSEAGGHRHVLLPPARP